MCVIMVVQKGNPRPSKLMMDKAWGLNDDGAGIAYRKKNDKDTVVVWRKNLEEGEMQELCNTVPLPYVAHWRIASIGGILPELAHPFPIDVKASLALEGETPGSVLFHNGTWPGWADAARHAALQTGTKIPTGKWSDSRAIAWLMSIYGDGFMELLDTQRGVSFGSSHIDFFSGPGWTKINDIWCSNDHFMTYSPRKVQEVKPMPKSQELKPMCQYSGCQEQGWLDTDKRCSKHPKTSFPTNGHGTTEVSKVSPPPFQSAAVNATDVISLAAAKLLSNRRKQDGSRVLSKNLFKDIQKMHSRIAQGGKKGERALQMLVLVSKPFLNSFGGLRA